MPASQNRRNYPQSSRLSSVFLNIPYDKQFSGLFLAYLAGISAFGLTARATLEIPGSSRRLERIVSLIQACRYSIHDISRVEMDATPPSAPRFNMPFDLGLAVSHAQTTKSHIWLVFETEPWRVQKSLSDLNGTDIYVHRGTVEGVFRELANSFVRIGRQPSVQVMAEIFEGLKRSLPGMMRQAGADTPFQARVFRDLSIYAGSLAGDLVRKVSHRGHPSPEKLRKS